MTISAFERRELERVRYWQGQTLRSSDLHAQIETDGHLRSWHNRALHNAFGVALGFTTTVTTPLTAIKVKPGVAYDCFGRTLILMSDQEIAVPAAPAPSNSITLMVRYRETAEFPKPGEIAGVCPTCCDDSQFQEAPMFAWKSTSLVTIKDGVPIARVLYVSGAAVLDPSFSVLTTRPLAKPYLANGSTIPGSTAWSPWTDPNSGEVLGLQTLVDTSAAGFTRTPCYFAWLASFDDILELLNGPPVIFTHIQEPKIEKFNFRIMFPLLGRFRQVSFLAARTSQRVSVTLPYVCWLGCESQPDISLGLQPQSGKVCC